MKAPTTNHLIRIAQQYRAYVRAQAPNPNRRDRHHYPILIIDGEVAPVARGSSWGYETKTGKPIYHPSAYSKVGWSSMVYSPSTYRVEVGRDWLSAHHIPEWAMKVLTKAEAMVRAGACGSEGLGGLALGMSAERVVEEIGIRA